MTILRHAEKEIGGTRLVALEDRLGQHIEILVLANFVSVEQHRGDPELRRLKYQYPPPCRARDLLIKQPPGHKLAEVRAKFEPYWIGMAKKAPPILPRLPD
jgi:hypothetical protein